MEELAGRGHVFERTSNAPPEFSISRFRSDRKEGLRYSPARFRLRRARRERAPCDHPAATALSHSAALRQAGLCEIKLRGVSKSALPSRTAFRPLSAARLKNARGYVKDGDTENYYWTRRGPSIHLSYPLPTETDCEWFYNELTVPSGLSPVGTYAMAIGFDCGYFGIQVNSPSERRILFSVWSPYSTDDPSEIPDELRVRLLGKGDGVVSNDFGGEGSGGPKLSSLSVAVRRPLPLRAPPPTRGSDSGEFPHISFSRGGDGGFRFLFAPSLLRLPPSPPFLPRKISTIPTAISPRGSLSHQWARTRSGAFLPSPRARHLRRYRSGAIASLYGRYARRLLLPLNGGFFNDTAPPPPP